MKKISTRIVAMPEITEEERNEFANWAWQARSRTTFDLNIIGHPRAVMFIAENGTRTAYLPVQTVLMAECFIPKPGADNREKAHCLGMFDRALLQAAEKIDVADVYTYIPDIELPYISKVQHHGWKEVPNVRLFKKTVNHGRRT